MLPELNVQSHENSVGGHGSTDRLDPMHDLVQYFQDYARENPGAAALWCLGIGFVLGWKLKPW